MAKTVERIAAGEYAGFHHVRFDVRRIGRKWAYSFRFNGNLLDSAELIPLCRTMREAVEEARASIDCHVEQDARRVESEWTLDPERLARVGAEMSYKAGWHYAEQHPDESQVPEWVVESEWCAGFADFHSIAFPTDPMIETQDRVTVERQDGAEIFTDWGIFTFNSAETARDDFLNWCREMGATPVFPEDSK